MTYDYDVLLPAPAAGAVAVAVSAVAIAVAAMTAITIRGTVTVSFTIYRTCVGWACLSFPRWPLARRHAREPAQLLAIESISPISLSHHAHGPGSII